MALPEVFVPAGLPPFKADPHIHQPLSLYAPVPRHTGADRRRRIFRSAPRTLQAALELTQAQLEAFFSWHEDVLKAGSLPFTAEVAKIGPGTEWWRARILSFTVEHRQGSHHDVSLEIFLEEGPFASAPAITGMTAEVTAALVAADIPTYPFALFAEARASLVTALTVNESMRIEYRAALQADAGARADAVPLDAEVLVHMYASLYVEPPPLLEAEVSAGLITLAVPDSNLVADISAALLTDLEVGGGAGPVADPADVFVLAYRPVYPDGYARAAVSVATDGQIYKYTNNDLAQAHALWYSPLTMGAGTGYWVRATKTSGPDPAAGSEPLNVWLSLSTLRYWGNDQALVGSSTTELDLDIAADPDGTMIVSSFSASLGAEYGT